MTTPLPEKIHMLGICGTAMAALAGLLKEKGCTVTGTDDAVYPPMSDHLDALGITYQQGYRAENIPKDVSLVVVGNVITRDNPEAAEMRRREMPHVSMAEAIKTFAIGPRHTVAVVGTHGKTTTTSLAAHTLRSLGADPGFLVGGIAMNFSSNFHTGAGDVFVIEGDEYDTAYFDKTPKFFKYKPDTLIFTSLEFDHADIYDDLATIEGHFSALLGQIPAEGTVFACADDPGVTKILAASTAKVVTYGESPNADFHLKGWHPSGEGIQMETEFQGQAHSWHLPMPGRHNALNASAVIALALSRGDSANDIAKGLRSFQGVKRRQEVRGVADQVTVMDDFAHHPTAIALTIEAIAGQYPGQRLWAVFEPRSYTARSNRFQKEFTEAFSQSEFTLLAPPFTPKNTPKHPPLDTEAIAEELRAKGKQARACSGTDEILKILGEETTPGDVVLIMSNGGFDDIHKRLLNVLEERKAEK